MVNPAHLDILKRGASEWNSWRLNNRGIKPDLSGANLEGIHLVDIIEFPDDPKPTIIGVDFSKADLSHANLRKANLPRAMFQGAYLRGADFTEAVLEGAYFDTTELIGANFTGTNLTSASFFAADMRQVNLTYANLTGAFLSKADLFEAEFSGATLIHAILQEARLAYANLSGSDLSKAVCLWADLGGANLSHATLYRTDLTNVRLIDADLQDATLIECRVYGLAAWDVKLSRTTQADLLITFYDQFTVTVDDLATAQFVYMLLKNEYIGRMIDSITAKVVLILGRFSPERKAVLDAIREELRKRDYTPIIFDFEKPSNRSLTETIVTLAHLSRFIIADISDPKSIPLELQAIIPTLPSVPVQPIIDDKKNTFGMFESFKPYHWVLPLYEYGTQEHLLVTLLEKVIQPAEKKLDELR